MALNKILTEESYKQYMTANPFPAHDIDPEKKDSIAWCRQIALAIWSNYCLNNSGLPFSFGTNQYDYTTLRLYAEGNQDINKYKKMLGRKNPDKDDDRRGTYNAISWDNHSVLPRFEQVILEKLAEFDVNYSAVGVDDATITEKTRIKNIVWERAQNKFYEQVYSALGEQMPEMPFKPADKQELELWSSMTLEMAYEMKMTEAVKYCMNRSEWDDELAVGIRRDLFRLGVAAVYEYVETHSKMPKVDYCDPAFTIFPKSNKYGYQDIPWAGDVVFMTVIDVRKQYKAKGQYISEEQFFQDIQKCINTSAMAQTGAFGLRMFPNVASQNFTSMDSHGAFPYDYLKVPVLRCEYKTWNTDVYSEIKTKSGETVTRREKYTYNKNDEKRSTVKRGYETWYKCWWVIGTDLVIDYGPKEYIKRDAAGKTYSGYTIIRTDNRSFVARMIPYIDEIELIHKRFMMAWREAAPSGFAVYMSALKNVTFKDKKVHPMDLLSIYADTGKIVIDDGVLKNVQGKAVNPIMPLPGGLGPLLNEFMASYQFFRAQLSDITGISDAMLGANPIPGQLKSTTEIALEGSEKVIRPLGRAYNIAKKRVFEKLLCDIKTIARFTPDGFRAIFQDLSLNTVQKIVVVSDDASRDYALKAEPEATELMKQEIIVSAKESAAKGQITYPDYLQVVRYVGQGKVRFATALLEYKLQKRVEQEQQINMQNIQANAEVQQQSLEQKAKMDAMLLQLEGRMAEVEQRIKGDYTLENTRLKGETDLLLQEREFKHEIENPQPAVSK